MVGCSSIAMSLDYQFRDKQQIDNTTYIVECIAVPNPQMSDIP